MSSLDSSVFTLLSCEIEVIARSPEVLKILIDWHEHQATMAGAMGYETKFHDDQIKVLTDQRNRAEAEREARS